MTIFKTNTCPVLSFNYPHFKSFTDIHNLDTCAIKLHSMLVRTQHKLYVKSFNINLYTELIADFFQHDLFQGILESIRYRIKLKFHDFNGHE